MTKTLPNRFEIQLPDGWTRLPLDRDEVRRLVDETASLLGDRALPTTDVQTLKALLGKMVVEAEDAGVVLAASYIDFLPEDEVVPATSSGPVVDDSGTIDPETLPQVLLSAVAMLATFGADQITSDGVSISIRAVEAALQTPADGTRYLGDPETVSLQVGIAVEVRAIETINAPEFRKPPSIYVQSYYLPVASGNGLAVLTFRTPCLGLADEFTRLFRLMAESLLFKD